MNSIAVNGGSLAITSVVSHTGGGNAHLLKQGTGTLELAGSAANTFNGNTYVADGTLLLNKSGAVQALPNGEVMIGDNLGGDNADQLVYAATAGTDQIGDRVVRDRPHRPAEPEWRQRHHQQHDHLDVGPTFSADVATGTAGVLTNNNQFTVVNQAGTTADSVPATFTGIYDLNGGTRNIDVRRRQCAGGIRHSGRDSGHRQ